MALSERIRTGELAPGRGLPSERQLSEDLSVSRMVVRAALQELQRQGLIECKPRCRPTVVASKPIRRSSQSAIRYVAVWLWPSAGDFCSASILRGLQRVELPGNLRLVVANAVGDDLDARKASEARFLDELSKDGEAAGAVIWYVGGQQNLDALTRARSSGVPIVFLDRLPPTPIEADFVGTDNAGSARRAVEHLTALGHRRIALITNIDKVSSVLAREIGYRKALADAGIEFDPTLVGEVENDEPEGATEVVDRLLSLTDPPTAIFGINDLIALQVHGALSSRKIEVPRQMSVLGFDGLLRWIPGGGYLSSACQDFEGIGQTAIEMLLDRIEGNSPSAHRHVLFDAPVRTNASTARFTRPQGPIEVEIESSGL